MTEGIGTLQKSGWDREPTRQTHPWQDEWNFLHGNRIEGENKYEQIII